MKRNLLKAIGISFLLFFVLSWVIPVGTYTGGKLTTTSINPVGLIDLFSSPISAFVTFILYGVVFAVIGGFYGVAEKTGALEKATDKLAGFGKNNNLLIITTVLFTLLSSFTGLVIPLFMLAVLFGIALLKKGYDKVTVLASTVGSLLLGSVASTYGFNISGYTKNILSLDMNSQIWAKVIMLILLVCLYAFTVNRYSKITKQKKTKVEVKESEPETKTIKAEKKTQTKTVKKSNKKNTKKTNTKALAVSRPIKKVSDKKITKATSFVIVLALMLIVAFVGMYNWYYSFGIDVFNKMYEAVMGVKIKDFAIFENIFSGASQFGYWSNVEFSALIVAGSMLLGFVYKLSLNDYVESFIAGIKKWLPTAIYATLASVILSVLYQSLQMGTGTLVDTINGWLFGLVDGFNPVIVGVASLISSFFFNDLYYLLVDLNSFMSGFDSSSISIAGLLIQSVYGIGMMIFPTSVLLIAGLSYYDVSYKEWFKYIFKFALIAFLFVLLVCGILTLI